MVGNIRHIVVFESLPNGEKKTGEELYKDCISRQIDLLQNDSIKMSHKYYNVRNKGELIELIKYYQVNAEFLNNGLLFHFEMHGDSDLKGLVLADGSLITWKELVELFRPINVTTKDKLFITMATCNGRYLYQGVNAYEKSPYSGYISASKEVLVNEILEDFAILFEELIDNGNIVAAYLELEKKGSNFYYKDSERTFEEAFLSTIQKQRNDPQFKEEILQDTEKATGKRPTEDEYKIILEKVINDLYTKQKDAFNFN